MNCGVAEYYKKVERRIILEAELPIPVQELTPPTGIARTSLFWIWIRRQRYDHDARGNLFMQLLFDAVRNKRPTEAIVASFRKAGFNPNMKLYFAFPAAYLSTAEAALSCVLQLTEHKPEDERRDILANFATTVRSMLNEDELERHPIGDFILEHSEPSDWKFSIPDQERLVCSRFINNFECAMKSWPRSKENDPPTHPLSIIYNALSTIPHWCLEVLLYIYRDGLINFILMDKDCILHVNGVDIIVNESNTVDEVIAEIKMAVG